MGKAPGKRGMDDGSITDGWLGGQKAFPSETRGLVKVEKHRVIKKSLGPIL